MRLFQFLIAALGLLTTISCTHAGQRLLTIQIELNGRVVFQGIRGVPDNLAIDKIWNIIGDVTFTSDSDQPQTIELTGDIVVRIKHVESELANAKLEALSLECDTTNSGWRLQEGEANRVKKIASG
jgi:hypothetical protein